MLVKLSRTHYGIEVLLFFERSLSYHLLLPHYIKFFSFFTAASVSARGSYMEVKTDMREMLYEALRRVLPNPSDAAVISTISKWRTTITTTSIINLENKNT